MVKVIKCPTTFHDSAPFQLHITSRLLIDFKISLF
jgi:hypothetical protein